MKRLVGLLCFLCALPVVVQAQNPYYDHGLFPSPGSPATSASMRAELDLIESGFNKLPTLSGNSNKMVVINSSGTALTSRSLSGSVFPSAPTVNDMFLITTADSAGDCSVLGGGFRSLCVWDGNDWSPVIAPAGGLTGWPQTRVDEITWADAIGTAACIGSGTNPLCIYEDATLGGIIRPKTLGHTNTYIWNGFTHRWYDILGDTVMFTINPAGVGNLKYVWASGYRPVKTLSIPADALYPRGSSTVVTDTALISGGLVSPYLTTTDSDLDGGYRYVVMDPKWDGGTVTATVHVVNTNATPGNAFRVDVSGECFPAGTLVQPTISTTGEQSAIFTFGSSGSCGGSACNQNDPVSVTTAAITINGTPAGGNYCGFQAQTHATGTTETVGGIKIVQMDIHYNISKGF